MPTGKPMLCRGDQLHREDQRLVLASFVNRYTGDHTPDWAKRTRRMNGEPYPVQFLNDQDWLRNSFFRVRLDGRLHGCGRHCHSYPTWPHSPHLRKLRVA